MTLPHERRLPHGLFVDTSAFFAAAYPPDANYQVAQDIFRRAVTDGALLVTTSFIVAESHALFLARAGRDSGVEFLRRLDDSTVSIVRPTEEDEGAAREIIYRYTDKDFSLTDAISFVVMERLHIPTAFTFDRDFERYGISVARP